MPKVILHNLIFCLYKFKYFFFPFCTLPRYLKSYIYFFQAVFFFFFHICIRKLLCVISETQMIEITWLCVRFIGH